MFLLFELQVDINGDDVVLHTFLERCESVYTTTWLAILYVYKGVLMVRMCSSVMEGMMVCDKY